MVSVVGLLVLTGIPTTVGVCEGLSAQKKTNAAAKEKAKFNLTATVSLDGERFEECYCVLKDGMVSPLHESRALPHRGRQGEWLVTCLPRQPQLRGTSVDDITGRTGEESCG